MSGALGLEPRVVRISSAKASRELPTPYGVFSILYDGKLIADRPVSARRFSHIMSKIAEPAVGRVRIGRLLANEHHCPGPPGPRR